MLSRLSEVYLLSESAMNREKSLSLDEMIDLYPGMSIKEMNQILHGAKPTTPASWWPGAQSVYDFQARPLSQQRASLSERVVDHITNLRNHRAIEIFETLHKEHSREYVATKNLVDYINDSSATNVNATWFALESMVKPTVLLMWWQTKEPESTYEQLIGLVKQKVTGIICLGQDPRLIHDVFGHVGVDIVDVKDMHEAVRVASSMAQPYHTVLLSPAAASFDRFVDHRDRGQQFKTEVISLQNAA